jgi:hypothetical protein
MEIELRSFHRLPCNLVAMLTELQRPLYLSSHPLTRSFIYYWLAAHLSWSLCQTSKIVVRTMKCQGSDVMCLQLNQHFTGNKCHFAWNRIHIMARISVTTQGAYWTTNKLSDIHNSKNVHKNPQRQNDPLIKTQVSIRPVTQWKPTQPSVFTSVTSQSHSLRTWNKLKLIWIPELPVRTLLRVLLIMFN